MQVEALQALAAPSSVDAKMMCQAIALPLDSMASAARGIHPAAASSSLHRFAQEQQEVCHLAWGQQGKAVETPLAMAINMQQESRKQL